MTNNKKQLDSQWQIEEAEEIEAGSEDECTQTRIKSIRSRLNESMVVTRGNYVLVESRVGVRKELTGDAAVFSELVNESSNTNYSADELSDSSATELFCAQVRDLWTDAVANKLMASLKLFYKPEQLRTELTDTDREQLAANELVCIDQEAAQVFDVDAIKSKCSVFDFDQYEK